MKKKLNKTTASDIKIDTRIFVSLSILIWESPYTQKNDAISKITVKTKVETFAVQKAQLEIPKSQSYEYIPILPHIMSSG